MNSAFEGDEELSRSRGMFSALVDNTLRDEICLILYILRKPNSLIAI